MKLRTFLPVTAAALLASGCASSITTGTVGDWYAVTAPETSFYRYGPLQASGPDSKLPKDSIMKVIRPSFGYVKVQLQDGASGYVASEDIHRAPATLVKEKLTPPPLPPDSIASENESFDLNSDDPRLIAPPEPLPEASPTPKFRY